MIKNLSKVLVFSVAIVSVDGCKQQTTSSTKDSDASAIETCENYQPKEGELRASHPYVTSGSMQSNIVYNFNSEQELLKSGVNANDAQWYSRVCTPQFKAQNSSYHVDKRQANLEALANNLKDKKFAAMVEGFILLGIYHTYLNHLYNGKPKISDPALADQFAKIEKYVNSMSLQDSSQGLGLRRGESEEDAEKRRQLRNFASSAESVGEFWLG